MKFIFNIVKKGTKLKRVILSPDDYQKLLETEKIVQNKKIYRRIQAFKLLNKGYLNKEVAEYFSVDITTISNWIAIYREGGIEALLSLEYKGRPSRLSDEQISELKEEVSRGTFAISADIQHYMKEKFGVNYKTKYIPELAKKIGLSFKKTIAIPGKSQTEETQKTIHKILNLLEEDSIVYFFDTCHIIFNPVIAKMWQIKGKNGSVKIKTNNGRKRISIPGAIDLQNVSVISTITEETCNSVRIIEFFEKLRRNNPGRKIVIILDNAPYI